MGVGGRSEVAGRRAGGGLPRLFDRRLPHEGHLSRLGPHRRVGHAGEGEASVGDPAPLVHPHDRERAGEGEVAVAAGDLLARPSSVEGRHAHLDQQLVVGQRSGQKAKEEVGGLDRPLAAGGASDERGVEGAGHRRQLGGGIAVGQAAADRAARADGLVADERQARRQQRCRRPDVGCALGLALGDGRADGEAAVGAHVLELGQPADVDQDGGAGQPQGEQGDQALAAGEHLGFVAVLGQHGEGLVDGVGGVVVEGRRLHRRGAYVAARGGSGGRGFGGGEAEL